MFYFLTQHQISWNNGGGKQCRASASVTRLYGEKKESEPAAHINWRRQKLGHWTCVVCLFSRFVWRKTRCGNSARGCEKERDEINRRDDAIYMRLCSNDNSAVAARRCYDKIVITVSKRPSYVHIWTSPEVWRQRRKELVTKSDGEAETIFFPISRFI